MVHVCYLNDDEEPSACVYMCLYLEPVELPTQLLFMGMLKAVFWKKVTAHSEPSLSGNGTKTAHLEQLVFWCHKKLITRVLLRASSRVTPMRSVCLSIRC